MGIPNVMHDTDEVKCKDTLRGAGWESWIRTRGSGIFPELKG